MSRYRESFQSKRMSRRRILMAAGAGATGLAAAQALGLTPISGARASGTSPYGGTYINAIAGDWGTLDPVTSVAYGPSIFPRIYNTFVSRSTRRSDVLIFDLAERVEQPDEQTYLFDIRSGARIAPNNLGVPQREMDAFDAKAWLDHVAQATNAIIRGLTNQWLDSYEVPDARTFRLVTRGAYAYFLFRLGNPVGGCIPPREFFERPISMRDQGAGAGPFGVIAPGSFSETGGIILQRNPHYYNPMLPYVDRIQVVRMSDRSARRAAWCGC